MKMYRASDAKIEAIEIISQTDKTVTFKGTAWQGLEKERFATTKHAWRDSWDEAQQWLIDRAQSRVSDLEAQLELAQSELAKAQDITP